MQLRKQAEDFREMAAHGADIQLRAALLMLADEFDHEAAEMEAVKAPRPRPEPPGPERA